MFKHILVGYDSFSRDEEIPALAIALAREHGADLHAVNVVPELPHHSFMAESVTSEELHAALVDRRQDRLDALLAPARERGIVARASIRSGAPHVEIIREAMAIGADLVIVCDLPLRRGDERGFGAVTRKLLRKCPCPVLAKRDVREIRHERVLAALDVESEEEGERRLNAQILAVAATLARRASARLLLFHAWSLWGEQMLRSRSRATDEEVDAAVDETERSRRERIEQIAAESDLEGIEVEVALAKGTPRRLLPEVAAEREIDIVVMGTVCRTGVGGFLIGNTAEAVLNDLSCSVLAVKPEGFVSPVTPED